MILEFKLDRKVFIQTVFFMNYKRPVMIILQLIGVVLIGMWFYAKFAIDSQTISILNLVFGLSFLLFVPLIIFLRSLRMSRASSRIMEKLQVDITKEMFKVSGESYKHEYSWSKIIKVKETSFAYLIYVSKLQAHIIPISAMNLQQKSELNDVFKDVKGPQIFLKQN